MQDSVRNHSCSSPLKWTTRHQHSYYNAVIMVDIFQFSNSYTLLPDIADAVQYGEEEDEGTTDLPTECENYVFTGERESTGTL